MENGPIWETERGTMIRVIVKPKSKEGDLISEITLDAIIMNLSSQAREGKANIELLKRLSKMLRLSTSDISIITGHKSKEKTLLVKGKSVQDIRQALSI